MAYLASGAGRKCSDEARAHCALGQITFLRPFNKNYTVWSRN